MTQSVGEWFGTFDIDPEGFDHLRRGDGSGGVLFAVRDTTDHSCGPNWLAIRAFEQFEIFNPELA
jgi:hypothetical protein